MNALLERLLGKATQLTRTGRLAEATAAIQAALRGGAHLPASPPRAPTPAADSATKFAPTDAQVIDVEAREVPDAANDAPAPARPAQTTPDASRAAPVGEGEFIAASYQDAHGQRDYKLYLPPSAGGALRPLLVMLHGCTQNPDDFAAGTRANELAREQGFVVLYPAQPGSANTSGCWNWFKHNHQRRGAGEPALIAGMVQAVVAQHRIDPARVFVAGLSAGGAMAAILGDAYPDVFAAVGVHSGLPTGAATDVMGAFSAMRSGSGGGSSDGGGGMLLRGMRAGARPAATPGPRRAPPTIVFHGDADATVNVVNGEQVVQACVAGAQVNAGVPAPVEERMSNNGRTTTRRTWHDANGRVLAEHWLLAGAGHAWSGGSTTGTYADARGPDATREMLRFFHALDAAPIA